MSPIKVMAGARMYIPSAFVGKAAKSASGCEGESHHECRAAGHRLSEPLVRHHLIAPEFGYRERTPHVVIPLSEAQCLTVCETGR